MLLAAAVLAWYFLLDVPLAATMLVVNALLLYLADIVSRQPIGVGAVWFVVLFGGGWVIQLVGHEFEGRKPALADNFFQVFVAPIFLAGEVFFALGYKPRLHAAVQERAREMRAAAGIVERPRRPDRARPSRARTRAARAARAAPAGTRPSPRRCERAGRRRPAPGDSRSCRRSPGSARPP